MIMSIFILCLIKKAAFYGVFCGFPENILTIVRVGDMMYV